MNKINCWEFHKCGREPDGHNAHELGICPAAVFSESDGFCGGKNGGRACMYVAGTFCLEYIPGTHREALRDYGTCGFYKMLKQEHGHDVSVFSFQRYFKEKNNDLHGLSEHVIYKVSPVLRKEDFVKAEAPFRTRDINDIWPGLLGLVDYCNRAVKQGEWYPEDKKYFYNLKDAVMEKLYRDPPSGTTVSLKKVPYEKNYSNCADAPAGLTQYVYSPELSDLAGGCGRPSANTCVQETVLIEMEVTFAGRMYCFHIPHEKAKDWELDLMSLSARKWVPSREFNRQFFKDYFEEIRTLLDLVSGL